MSPINFGPLIAEHPRLLRAWRGLSLWFAKPALPQFIDVRRLAKDLPDIEPGDLALALGLMAEHGLVHQTYRVATPEGVLLDQDFSSPEEIPDRMPGRFYSSTFDTNEGDIVPGFRLETPGARR